MSLSPRFPQLPSVIMAVALAACGGGSADDDDDEGSDTVDPSGTDHTYAVSALSVPENSTSAEKTRCGFDLNGNGAADNTLGTLLVALRSFEVEVQSSLDEEIETGGLILLANVKATDLSDAAGVGLWIYGGQTTPPPTPAPCTDPETMTDCGHHLEGDGAFTVDSTTATDQMIVGDIVDGTFTGGPGEVTLQLSVAGGDPIALPLQNAHAELTGLTAEGWELTGSKIGGAISSEDLDGTVIPGIAATIRGTVAEDCEGTEPPDCGCAADSTGASMIDTFDGRGDGEADCEISDDEVADLANLALSPDIDLDGDDTNDAVSVGICLGGVSGTFEVPAE